MENEPSAKISKACNSCKEKKKKCDRASPRCGYCARNGLTCKYRALQKPGLPVGYGNTMLDKLLLLDAKIEGNQESALLELRVMADQLKDLKSKVKLILNQTSTIPNTFSSVGVLSVESLTTSSDSLSQHASDSADRTGSDRSPERNLALAILLENARNVLFSLPSWPLPSLPIVGKLVDLFFLRIFPGFRVVHPSSRNALLDLYAQHLASRSPDASKIAPNFLGVILCAIRFAHQILLSEEIDRCRNFCRTTILSKCIGVALVEDLQAMTLLAYDLFGKSNNPRTWGYISLISCAVIHLNLTKEPPASEKLSFRQNDQGTKRAKILSPQNVISPKTLTPFDEECHRNLFWEIYILDRLSSVSNSFPCKLDGKEIDRQLPIKASLWTPTMDEEMNQLGRKLKQPAPRDCYDSAAYLIEIVNILGDIHLFLRESIDVTNMKEILSWQMKFSEFDNELLRWKASLPMVYQQYLDLQVINFEQNVTVKDVLLFSIYHMAVIRLNSALGYQKFDSNYFLFSNTARTKCLDSAESIASFSEKLPVLLGHLQGEIFSSCGPFFGFTVWVAARLLLVNAINNGEGFSPSLDQLISVLTKMGHTWESCMKYRDILGFLKDEELENMSHDLGLLSREVGLGNPGEVFPEGEEGNAEERYHSKSAKVFSDMRFNAYSLDVLLSKKIEQFRKEGKGEISPHNQTDFSNFFEWFKMPINELNSPFFNQVQPGP